MSLGPDARALIATADGGDDPSSADEARVRAKLAARLAVAAGTGIAATTAAKTATAGAGKAATMTFATKVAIGVAVVSATTAGGTVLYERTLQSPTAVVIEVSAAASTQSAHAARPTTTAIAEPSAEVSEPPAPTATATATATTAMATATPTAMTTAPAPKVKGAVAPRIAATPTPTPTSTITATATPTAPSPVVATDTIAEEASLLRTAHSALATGDGTSVMRALDEHARRFPRGALAEERDAARVLALCAQGRAPEARASASAFVSSNPRSPFAAQVRRSCASKNDP